MGHFYTQWYDQHFLPYRFRAVKLLEIGVWEGASLQMWSRYFANGEITGADTNIERCTNVPERCRLWQVDQSSEMSLVNMAKNLGPWDIIIDDGSHNPAHQILSFEVLWPYLNEGGTYAVEDLHPNYKAFSTTRPSFIDFLHTLTDDLNARGKLSVAFTENNSLSDRNMLVGREKEIESIHLYRSIALITKLGFKED